ncbi:MAG: transposase [Lysobacteraceae bacterium]|nr:MAG: transposase [Xanthomonadaceae bacterium]
MRRGRYSLPGQIYLLTAVTHQREALFSGWPAASAAASILYSANLWSGANLLCWVLMPDHWHGLVELTQSRSLADLMKIVKGRSAHQINIALERKGPVWMPGFHDRALRREENLLQVARYVVANPVRGGLVKRAADYPYWDAVWLP